MTKKHFRALAEAISKITNDEERKRTSDLVGKVCANANPLFNWTRWEEATGANETVQIGKGA